MFLKIHKILLRPHIEYCTQAWVPVLRHGNRSLILRLEDIQRKSHTKDLKKMVVDPSLLKHSASQGTDQSVRRAILEKGVAPLPYISV